MISKQKKQDIIKTYATKDGDTGSCEVQIAILTGRIVELTQHLKKNPKDNHSRRGLIGMVEKRKKLLKYLQKTNLQAFVALKEKLSIR